MEDHRLPHQAYKMLLNQANRGKTNWATKVRDLLTTYGFYYVWEFQSVGCAGSFIKIFKQRLIDCRWQNWNDHLNSSDRFMQYRKFKSLHCIEPYLLMNVDRFIRYSLTRFRFGVSRLTVHSLRYRRIDERELQCPMCKSDVESEVHFVFCCPAYEDLRHSLIHPKFYNNPSDFRLTLLLASKNEQTSWKFAMYLYKAFKRRDIALS